MIFQYLRTNIFAHNSSCISLATGATNLHLNVLIIFWYFHQNISVTNLSSISLAAGAIVGRSGRFAMNFNIIKKYFQYLKKKYLCAQFIKYFLGRRCNHYIWLNVCNHREEWQICNKFQHFWKVFSLFKKEIYVRTFIKHFLGCRCNW